jgi:hypothetical protein
MAQRAFALEAGAAFEMQTEDPGLWRERRREAGRRRAIERNQRPVEGGGDVHQA